jgi:hypothetical protein
VRVPVRVTPPPRLVHPSWRRGRLVKTGTAFRISQLSKAGSVSRQSERRISRTKNSVLNSWCQVCAGPVTHRGVARRFCSTRCSGLGARRLGAARLLRIEWRIIAAELQVSVSTVQRLLLRAGAPISLPAWIRREADRNAP